MLKVKNLAFEYGKNRSILKNVSFDLEPLMGMEY